MAGNAHSSDYQVAQHLDVALLVYLYLSQNRDRVFNAQEFCAMHVLLLHIESGAREEHEVGYGARHL